MPNWVTNVLTGPVEVVSALTRHRTDEEVTEDLATDADILERVTAKGGEWPYRRTEDELRAEVLIDFNLLIPEPENIEVGGCSGEHEPGVICWYAWHQANWGTKWGGSSVVYLEAADGTATLRFDTAWAHPIPIIVALAHKFPEAIFDVKYADEDFGSNVGQYKIDHGEMDEGVCLGGTPEGEELAAQILYGKTAAEVKAEWDAEEQMTDGEN